ncbi:DUF2785 domain-containing protein [Brevibacillus choshinensis]
MDERRMALIRDLQRLEEEHYQLREGEELQGFVTQLLHYIGDPDPHLRDELIYPTFQAWIAEQKRFTGRELTTLLEALTDDQHLFYQIGNEKDESVFTRTFSVLPIALILQRHRKQPFLEQKEFDRLKHALLRYYREEKDLRGYVTDGGWAHGASHGADALDELIQCPESDAAVQLEVLDAVKGMLQNDRAIFCDEDDERMATIVDTMIDQNLLSQNELADWIEGLADCSEWPRSRSQRIACVNSKNFLRSLYFRRGVEDDRKGLAAAMLSSEERLNRYAIR